MQTDTTLEQNYLLSRVFQTRNSAELLHCLFIFCLGLMKLKVEHF